jgi:hypothetical protein
MESMGNRYLVTGVQLGMLIGLDSQKDRQSVVDEILSDQYVGESINSIMIDAQRMVFAWKDIENLLQGDKEDKS